MTLSQIIERVTIREILGPLASEMKQMGTDKYRGVCPVHTGAENKASFSIDEAKGFAHCFGCGENWNKIEMAMALHGLSRKEAAYYLAGLVGATLDSDGEDAVMAAEMRRAAAVEAKAVVAWRNSEYFWLWQMTHRYERQVEIMRGRVLEILALPPAIEEHPDLGWLMNRVMSLSMSLEEWREKREAMKKPDWAEWIARYRRMIRSGGKPRKLSAEKLAVSEYLINGGQMTPAVYLAMDAETDMSGVWSVVSRKWTPHEKSWFERQVLK